MGLFLYFSLQLLTKLYVLNPHNKHGQFDHDKNTIVILSLRKAFMYSHVFLKEL